MPQKPRNSKTALKFPVKIVENVDELLASKPKVVVEAASQQAVKDYYEKIVGSKHRLNCNEHRRTFRFKHRYPKVHFPSGAIGGLDALSRAALAGIDEVTLTSRKNPKALGKTNTEEEIVYEGYAEEAARQFPREMNVAATLALTVKPAKVKVQVVSDPKVKRNTHEIHVKWRYGEMTMRFANDPTQTIHIPARLAAWSAIKLLKSQLEK